MSKPNYEERLITNDETTGPIDENEGQLANKEGLQSSSRKPSQTGPDEHHEHTAPVDGAFGNPETREYDKNQTYIGAQAPGDKARK